MTSVEKLSTLIDDKEFQSLCEKFGRFNLFEAVGSVRGELRHSNFLSYLLSPSRPHGLGAEPLRRVLRAFAESEPRRQDDINGLEIALANLDRVVVHREMHAIDLLLEVRDLNLIVAIENKVGADEGEDQLLRYKNIITSSYKDWRKLFVFLTPQGKNPSDPDWKKFSYGQLANLIESIACDGRTSATAEVKLVINHYVEIVRRHIVQGEDLKDLALKVYEKHRDALDYIFEARPSTSGIQEVLLAVLKEKDADIEVDRESGSILNFLPKSWDQIASFKSCQASEWTKTGRALLFEIKHVKRPKNYVLLSLIVGPGHPEFRKYIYEQAQKDPHLFHGLVKPFGVKWSSIYSRQLLKIPEGSTMEEAEKLELVHSAFKQFLETEYPSLKEACFNFGNFLDGKPA